MDLTCDYHPKRQAADKCQKCDRLICLADKQHLSTSGLRQSSNRVLCPHCYYEEQKNSTNWIFGPKVALGLSLVIVLFFGSFLVIVSDSTFITVFLGSFIVIAVLVVNGAFWAARKIKSPSGDLERARELSFRLREETATSKGSEVSYCMNCGATVSGSNVKCNACGEPLYPTK